MRFFLIVCLLVFGVLFLGGKLVKQAEVKQTAPGKSVQQTDNITPGEVINHMKTAGAFVAKALDTAEEPEKSDTTDETEKNVPKQSEFVGDQTINVAADPKKESASEEYHDTKVVVDGSLDTEDMALTREAVLSDESSTVIPNAAIEVEPVDFKRISEINRKYARVSEILDSLD